MSNSSNENDPRLRQDKIERKDKENSSAGMTAGVIIAIIALVGLFLLYKYEIAPTTAVIPSQPAVVTAPPSATTNQNNAVPAANQNTNAPTTTNNQ